jgi:hypothetical protein
MVEAEKSLPNTPTIEEFAEELLTDTRETSDNAFRIGDRVLEGEKLFGKAAMKKLVDQSPLMPATVANYKSVAKAFPLGARRPGLGFGIHEVIRGLDEPDRDAAFDAAVKMNLSRTMLRKRVKAFRKGDKAAFDKAWAPPTQPKVKKDTQAQKVVPPSVPVEPPQTADESLNTICSLASRLDVSALNLKIVRNDFLFAVQERLREVIIAKLAFDKKTIDKRATSRRAIIDGAEEELLVVSPHA